MPNKVVIDPGHGGADSGAIGNGIIEKDLTLKISQYMKKRLEDLGIETSITRDSDITLEPTNRTKKVQEFYGKGSDVLVVSNHINAGGGDGAEIIYALRNNDKLSSLIAKEFINNGQNVRKYYQRRLPSDSSKDYYYMLRNTPNNESIIVEYGFLDGSGDDVVLLKNNYEQLTEGVVKAIANYLNVPYSLPNSNGLYIVKKGDTLWSIARLNNTTVDEIKRLNNLKTNSLTIGQQLILNETTTPDTNTYTVESGDTLYKIANQYNVSVDKIKELNNLNNNILSVGQKLIIPSSNYPVEEPIEIKNYYIVKPGDTLYQIAIKSNTTVEDIKKQNNLISNTLTIGQQLQIPTKTQYTTYTVINGDSLYSIARKFNTTVNNLISINNLATTNLSIGQKLLIPS
ncbi:MAG: LysM peptidoglycan-binding domain-containing protein [Bacilli bacterium]|nr:LysM peptidoglycan-binding domain-containing protein [Bacilli bacterium]